MQGRVRMRVLVRGSMYIVCIQTQKTKVISSETELTVLETLLTCITIDDTITDDTEMSTHFVMMDNTVLVNNMSRTDTKQ